MKSFLLIFCFGGCLNTILAQTNRFVFELEYSPNFSNITQEHFHFYTGEVGGLRFSNNLFLKGGYQLLPKLYATAGIGILQTRELISTELGGYLEITKIESDYFHSYVVTPVGVTYYIGAFFIRPEIGIGWNIHNRLKNHVYYADGSESSSTEEIDGNNINKTTYPVFLSIGYEISMETYSILIGLKGFYSLNPQVENYYEKWHYYGFGVVTGVKF